MKPRTNTIAVKGTVREELRRLAYRAASTPATLSAAIDLRAAIAAAVISERDLYPLDLTPRAVELVADQAPWIAYRYPDVFGKGLDEFKRTDHGIAERLRGCEISDVVVERSGSGRGAVSVTIELEGGDRLKFSLPYDWRLIERPARPSELAMAAVERQRRGERGA